MRTGTYDRAMRALAVFLAVLFAGSAPAGELRLAVTAFESGSADPALAPLGKGLQSMFTTDLSNIPGLEVVERARLAEIASEWKLASSGFVDPKTAAEAGRLLGATHLLTGSFTLLDQELRLDARLFSVGEGRVVLAESRSGERDLFFDLQKQLVTALVRELAGDVAPKVRVKIQRVQTADWDAFDAFSRGIDALDDADYQKALAELHKATTLDADFDLAAVTLDQAEQLVAELETKASALAAVERERARLDDARGVEENHRKATVVVQTLMERAAGSDQRARLCALWLLSRGYLNIQRQNAIAVLASSADAFAMERIGDALAARYLAEAVELWPQVPVTLDTEIFPKFPLHDTFEEDFAGATRFLFGEDDPDEHREALRRGLSRVDQTALALHLDRREEAELLAQLEPLGRTLPLDDRARWNQEGVARAAIRVLDTDRALRIAHDLSQTATDSGDVRDLAELADDARKIKAAIAAAEHPARVQEYLSLALQHSKSLDWVTEEAPAQIGGANPTERGWGFLLEEREWGPPFKWIGDRPTWMIQGRSRASTGPRSDERRADAAQWLSEREDDEPALLMVGAEPVSAHAVGLRIQRSAATDRPGPLPEGDPEVSWLFSMEDVDCDYRIEDNTRIVDRPTRALRVRFAADAVTLERVVEAERDGWHKSGWTVLEELARHAGAGAARPGGAGVGGGDGGGGGGIGDRAARDVGGGADGVPGRVDRGAGLRGGGDRVTDPLSRARSASARRGRRPARAPASASIGRPWRGRGRTRRSRPG